MCSSGMYVLGLSLALFALTQATVKVKTRQTHGLTETYLDVDWWDRAHDVLHDELNKRNNYNLAKNVILFIGDGLDITTITVARIYGGQKGGYVGEMGSLKFEEFPHVALAKTFANNMQVTESAAAAVALVSGVKTNAETVGCGPGIQEGNCSLVAGTKITSILDWARDAGKGTGIVTTSRVTHATPAATYAHSADRDWETDRDLPEDAEGVCQDIATQLVNDNPEINVILGGGRRAFLPNTTNDPEHSEKLGRRQDGVDLTEEWVRDKKQRMKPNKYVWNKDQFKSVDTDRTEYLLGLFEYSHMQFEANRLTDTAGEPSLAEMTETAIRMLRRHDKGFFLMVEGARIDHAHHGNAARHALEDTLAFDRAVQKALELTDEEETLIIVTADHAHPFTMGSWASINNPILETVDDYGFVYGPTDDQEAYLSLAYANGPGPVGRINATAADSTGTAFKFPVQVPMAFDTHGGQDVSIYAKGPMSHLINGVKENQYVAHVMAYAACIGQYADDCPRMEPQTTAPPSDNTGLTGTAWRMGGSWWLTHIVVPMMLIPFFE